MKTKMNLGIATFLIASILLGGFSLAGREENILPIENNYELPACSNLSRIYLNQDNDADGLPDFYLYLNSNFSLSGYAHDYTAGQIIRQTETTAWTTVKYYMPENNMLYKIASNNVLWPLDDATFWRASRAFPYNTPIRGIATTPNKVVFEQPADGNINKKTVWFIYNYGYKYAIGRLNNTSNYRYNQVPDMNRMANSGITYITVLPWPNGNQKREWSSLYRISDINKICRNYELHRCGDGIIDTYDSSYVEQFTWETCDDGPNNGKPGYCPAGCGNGWTAVPRCWDEILDPEWSSPYDSNGDGVADPGAVSFEQCDDGDTLWDTDGILNNDNPSLAFCSTVCLSNFSEEFTEEFING